MPVMEKKIPVLPAMTMKHQRKALPRWTLSKSLPATQSKRLPTWNLPRRTSKTMNPLCVNSCFRLWKSTVSRSLKPMQSLSLMLHLLRATPLTAKL
nr:MAG TPA: hypothetical protein [Caudoviricetes sp.]